MSTSKEKWVERGFLAGGLALGVLYAGVATAGAQSSGAALGPVAGAAAAAQGALKENVVISPKLEIDLNRAVTETEPLPFLERRGFRTLDDRVQVYVIAESGREAEIQEWLDLHGATHVSRIRGIVQAFVDPHALPLLAAQPGVVRVRRPDYVYVPEPPPSARALTAQLAGSMTTEALGPMNATAWQNAGYRGQGVKAGVIDSGFKGYATWVGTDLPPSERLHIQAFGGEPLDATEHGLMCAEIVTDIAPDVDLYLAAVNTTVDIVDATTWMKNNGVKVITMSLGWLSWGSGDGTGTLANNINSFVNGGGFWANSAGNSRLAHWQGVWQDGNGNHYMEFGTLNSTPFEINYVTDGAGNPVWLDAGTDINGALVWNQWSSPATDLDFCIYQYDGVNSPVEKTCADDEQSGQPGQLPKEDISWTTDAAGYYGFAIKWYTSSAPPTGVQIEMFNRFDSNPLLFNVQEGSITPPADTLKAMAAAAVNVDSMQLAAYSSKGPNNGPGGALAGGATKPDIAGFANVSCHAYGAGQCSGTSSASPHIAGAAVLVRSGYPSYTGEQVRGFLEQHAIDMGPSGKDTDFGVGRVYLGDPPSGPSCDAPGAPSNLAASVSTVASGTPFTLSWNAGSNADSYDVQLADNSGFANAQTNTVTGTSASATVTVSQTTTIYLRVRSKRTCGSTSGWSNTVTVLVTAGGGPTTYVYWVPVLANLTGSGGSHFYTDVGMLNRGSGSATVELRYHGSGGSVAATRSESVGANRQRIIENLLGVMGQSGKGSLEIRSNQPLTVTSRTYNDKGSGTFGQFYDSYTSSDALGSGQAVVLAHLVQNAKYRSNIGILNVGSGSATATVTLYSGSTQVGQFTITAAAGEYKQEDKVFQNKAGQTNVAEGWAKVQITAGSGVVVLASVLDNVTSDPTTIPMKP